MDEWSVDPFDVELKDDVIWERGAVDMKGTDTMVFAVLSHLTRADRRSWRPLTVTFFTDEEAGGVYGAR